MGNERNNSEYSGLRNWMSSNINKTGNISYILRACCEMQILNTEFLNSVQTITK